LPTGPPYEGNCRPVKADGQIIEMKPDGVGQEVNANALSP